MDCAINPKTGKPYTKHKLRTDNTRVTGYVGSFASGMKAGSYAYEVVCVREGCKRKPNTVTY